MQAHELADDTSVSHSPLALLRDAGLSCMRGLNYAKDGNSAGDRQ